MLVRKPIFLLTAFFLLLAVASAEVTDRIVRTLPLPSGTRLSLEITVGQVQVVGWDKPDVAVEIVRHAPDAARLALVAPRIEAGAEGVTIRARQPDAGRDASIRTDVTLRVPAAAALRDIDVFEGSIELAGLTGDCAARLERGAITAKDVSGAIRLETAMGDIRLERATLTPQGMMRLRTFNGNVDVGLAGKPSHARVLALSLGGTIASDIPLNRRERWGPRFGETTIGNGEPVLSIDVVNGNIAIRLPR
jgi:hypothetical protein